MSTHSRYALAGVVLCALAGCAERSPDGVESTRAWLSTSEVFVNELHYDNAGADVGEAIEIAAPAGTDLSGFTLVFYNGSNAQPYRTLELDGQVPDERGGYGAVAFEVAGIQNGPADGVALVDATGNVLELLSYEGTFTAVGGPADGMTSEDLAVSEPRSTDVGASLQRTGEGQVGGDFSWAEPRPSSFGTLNADQSFGGPPQADGGVDADGCGAPFVATFEVQGAGAASPLQGERVSVEGVVTALFNGADQVGGFYLQDPEGDGNPATSDGLFVFQGSRDDEVSVGDRVRVRGQVTEFYGLTELTDLAAVTVCESGVAVTPTPVHFPVDTDHGLEAYEGMWVNVTSPMTVTDSHNLGRYGELLVAAGGRLFNPAHTAFDDLAELEERRRDNRRRSLLLDDGSTRQNPEPLPLLAEDGTVRLGDTLAVLEGVVHYGFGRFRLHVTRSEVQRDNPRELKPDVVGGNLRVASFNVLNYFVTLGERGADDESELERQRAKLLAALDRLDADIVGLVELENGSAAVQDLVDALNQAVGANTYAALDPGRLGDDEIRVGVIYKPAQVRPVGEAHVVEFGAAGDPDQQLSGRDSLAQRFRYRGRELTIVINHFKSKGCRGATGPNQDDGQGCYNARRTAQAEVLADALPQLGDRVLVLGDLNAYSHEDPLRALHAAGLVDVVEQHVPPEDAYSYVFQGEAGALDHALASAVLAPHVTGVDVWHINADEPRVLDYNQEFNPPALYQPDAFRSSDHDPVLVGIWLTPDPFAMLSELRERLQSLSSQLPFWGLHSLSRRLFRTELALRAGRVGLALRSLVHFERGLWRVRRWGAPVAAEELARTSRQLRDWLSDPAFHLE